VDAADDGAISDGVAAVQCGGYRDGLASASNDDWGADRVHDSGAHRAEQGIGEAAAAVAAHHNELSALGLVNEKPSGFIVEDDDAAHGHVGVAFLSPGQALGQRLVCCRGKGRPLYAGKVRPVVVVPSVHGHQVDRAP